MSTLVRNLIRTAFYLDSVALMRMSSEVSALNNVDEAVLMIGTDANKSIMRDAALLTDDGQNATSRDLIVAIRAGDEAALAARRLQLRLSGPETDARMRMISG